MFTLKKTFSHWKKNDLILNVIEDNIIRNEYGTFDYLISLRMQSKNDNENLDETFPDKTELLNEFEMLRKQVELLSNCSYPSLPPTSPTS
ncbi:hypothetical protein NPIL_325631 [Nephila pilipes]|uniref:Uncharacterized protein n=1 Tax=Nephila pilipes TaxID=299642 RepID=A0A8X6MUR0_NEPPI|nr:hypothetical protein NPIL_325631 [Nephila pilipes]